MLFLKLKKSPRKAAFALKRKHFFHSKIGTKRAGTSKKVPTVGTAALLSSAFDCGKSQSPRTVCP